MEAHLSYWSSPQRAPVNSRHPESQGTCDRCGQIWHHSKLNKQMFWAGNDLKWDGFLTCPPCTDLPFELFRPLKLPPDPIPIVNPRPSWFDNTPPSTNPPTLNATILSSNNITIEQFFQDP